MRTSTAQKLVECARENKNIFLISGDAGYGVLEEYKSQFPKRYLNLGVAEQNAISFAAGLGLVGYKVFVYNIVPFVLFRCFEQVRNDICYQRVPVTLIGVGSGITYAPGGMTHYSVEDIGVARTLPGLVIFSPSDPLESRHCVEFAAKSKKPVYIRIAKKGEPIIHKGDIKDITKPLKVRNGKGVAVIFHGSISGQVIEALDSVPHKPVVVSAPMIEPLDFEALKGIVGDAHTIITVEEHFVDGGLGTVIAEWITKEKQPLKLKKLGIKNEFLHAIKNTNGMRELYGISSSKIADAINEAFKNE